MKPAPSSETAELLQRVRQQLILAQVRIMELEDGRDDVTPKLADTEKLLAAAQALADQKTDEAGHLAKVQRELQTQHEHLRHMQHVTNEALTDTRRQLADTTCRLSAAVLRSDQLQREVATLSEQATQLTATVSRLGLELQESLTVASARLDRVHQLDAEIRAMKASRSWRWTSWLRSLERALRKPNP